MREMSTVVGVLKILLNHVSTSSLLANIVLAKLQECHTRLSIDLEADSNVTDADADPLDPLTGQKAGLAGSSSVSFLDTCLYLSLFTLQRLMNNVSYVLDSSLATLGVTHLKLYAVANGWMTSGIFPFKHLQHIVRNLTDVDDNYVS